MNDPETPYAVAEKDITIPEPPEQDKTFVWGNLTQKRLLSFLVTADQNDIGTGHSVVIESESGRECDTEANCLMIRECPSADAAQELVAELHHLTTHHLVDKYRVRRTMVELVTFALYCKHHLGAVMMADEFHRPMFEDMVEIVEDAKGILEEELVAGHIHFARKTREDGGSHDKQDPESVRLGDTESSAAGEADPGADPLPRDPGGAWSHFG